MTFNPTGISGKQLADAISKHHSQIFYQQNLDSLPTFLQQEILEPGDLVLFLGAGNLNQTIPTTLELLSEK